MAPFPVSWCGSLPHPLAKPRCASRVLRTARILRTTRAGHAQVRVAAPARASPARTPRNYTALLTARTTPAVLAPVQTAAWRLAPPHSPTHGHGRIPHTSGIAYVHLAVPFSYEYTSPSAYCPPRRAQRMRTSTNAPSPSTPLVSLIRALSTFPLRSRLRTPSPLIPFHAQQRDSYKTPPRALPGSAVAAVRTRRRRTSSPPGRTGASCDTDICASSPASADPHRTHSPSAHSAHHAPRTCALRGALVYSPLAHGLGLQHVQPRTPLTHAVKLQRRPPRASHDIRHLRVKSSPSTARAPGPPHVGTLTLPPLLRHCTLPIGTLTVCTSRYARARRGAAHGMESYRLGGSVRRGEGVSHSVRRTARNEKELYKEGRDDDEGGGGGREGAEGRGEKRGRRDEDEDEGRVEAEGQGEGVQGRGKNETMEASRPQTRYLGGLAHSVRFEEREQEERTFGTQKDTEGGYEVLAQSGAIGSVDGRLLVREGVPPPQSLHDDWKEVRTIENNDRIATQHLEEGRARRGRRRKGRHAKGISESLAPRVILEHERKRIGRRICRPSRNSGLGRLPGGSEGKASSTLGRKGREKEAAAAGPRCTALDDFLPTTTTNISASSRIFLKSPSLNTGTEVWQRLAFLLPATGTFAGGRTLTVWSPYPGNMRHVVHGDRICFGNLNWESTGARSILVDEVLMPQCSTASCQGPKLYAHDSEESSKAKRISPLEYRQTNRTWCTPRCQQTVAKRLGLYLRVRFLVFELTRPPSSLVPSVRRNLVLRDDYESPFEYQGFDFHSQPPARV
ncbi:hypothetical protein DFH06DRAFT_1308658 [Mycena polygramma]|nr:hypothetical protein DFH06DRAFT_1308658 [Mycena polygramma]